MASTGVPRSTTSARPMTGQHSRDDNNPQREGQRSLDSISSPDGHSTQHQNLNTNISSPFQANHNPNPGLHNHQQDHQLDMAPVPAPAPATPRAPEHVGPHPSFIEVAKPYIFEKQIQQSLRNLAMTEAREDVMRLQGVAWIENVRKALLLPFKTFNTAVVYYHKFRLVHADTEYLYHDAAAAALFLACKTEDTLKKSRDILCAAHNLKVPATEHISSDDPVLETQSKVIIGMERLMLEASAFDFRSRHPQPLCVKLCKLCGFAREAEVKTAYYCCMDLYRTFAPLKQTRSTMAIASVEMAARLHDDERLAAALAIDYARLDVTRAEVMETLLDLVEFYTLHSRHSDTGQTFPMAKFIALRIELNRECADKTLPRFTNWPEHDAAAAAAAAAKPTTTKPPANGAAAAAAASNSNSRNGTAPASPAVEPGAKPTPSSTTSPAGISPGAVHAARAAAPRSAAGARGTTGTVRFMLDEERAIRERGIVDGFFTAEEEEYEVEVEVPAAAAAAAPASSWSGAAAGGERRREGERDRAREADRDRAREREWEREREKEREWDRRDREREWDRERERERRR